MSLQSTAMKNQTVLELTALADVSDGKFLVSAVKMSKEGINGTYFDVAFTTDAAPGGNPSHIELGEAIPAGTIIRLKGTIQA